MIPQIILDKRRFKPLNKVYLQIMDGVPVNEAAFAALFGFNNLGFEVVQLEHKDFFNHELEPTAMACGSVNMMKDALRKRGIPPPAPLDIPRELEPFCYRRIEHTTLRRLIDSEPTFPIFIKPDEQSKLFDGTVVTNRTELELFQHYDGLDTPIMTSEVLDIISEHRAFVIDRKVIDVRKYKGSYGTHPDLTTIESCIGSWNGQPVAYALDMGVTKEGKTVLIEANDAYALGSYGLDSYNYTKMMILRWKELTGQL